METLARPHPSCTWGYTNALVGIPSESRLCSPGPPHPPLPGHHRRSPFSDARGKDTPGATAAAPVPAPLGVVKFSFLAAFLLPLLEGFVSVQSLFSSCLSQHSWEESGSALAHPCGSCLPQSWMSPQSLHQLLTHLPVFKHLKFGCFLHSFHFLL